MPNHRPPFVLLVEDEDGHATLIKRSFELHGGNYEVVVADSLKQARELLHSSQCRLVIADLILPDGRGTDLMQEEVDQVRVPLIVMTSHGDEKVAVEAMKAGALDYVVKSEETFQSMPRLAQRAIREHDHIVERNRLEQQLVQAQKMESIGRLAGGVAHDFNNLLTIILGYTDLAMGEASPDDQVQKSIQQIRNAATRACDLTKQLLTFARRQAIQKQPLNVNELIRDTERLLRRVIGERIELVVRTKAVMSTVNGDPGQIQQVLLNLAVNARDAMPRGGCLTLSTAAVSIEPAESPEIEPGAYVKLTVQDSGAGMTPEVTQQIFEPFFTTKSSGKGTGLGLATCYGIIKQHSGYIQVKSQVGQGSAFDIFLPAVEAPVKTPTAPRQENDQKLPTGTETVLVVEDEGLVRALTTKILSSLQYNVLQAVDGQQALDLLEETNEPIDLLLTDVVMPNIGGVELAQRLRSAYPDLNVLFVSGYSESNEFKDDIAQAKAAFLHKPFSRKALAHKVRELLDGH